MRKHLQCASGMARPAMLQRVQRPRRCICIDTAMPSPCSWAPTHLSGILAAPSQQVINALAAAVLHLQHIA